MNAIIVYATKTGTTRKCAEILSKKLNGVKTVDLSIEEPDIKNFDIVIVAGSIRMGLLHKDTKRFIAKNKEILQNKKAFYFICNCITEKLQEIIKNNFPKEIIESAEAIDTFGGEINIDKVKGIDKFITKMVIKSYEAKNVKKPEILMDNIESFSDKIFRCNAKE